MFCYQCEQTSQCSGCTSFGVCGKSPETASLQDMAMHVLKGIGSLGWPLIEKKIDISFASQAVQEGLFTTITNVDFDPERLTKIISELLELRDRLSGLYRDNGLDLAKLPEAATFPAIQTTAEMAAKGTTVGIMSDPSLNEDIRSLRELLTYGIKGMAAYADHARVLGKEDSLVNNFFFKALESLTREDFGINELVALNMECGQVNLKCMEILDAGHVERFGHPEPTQVSLGVKKGPAILVSGHDLLDLEELLIQTDGKGVNVYTHGEMLPANAYPGLKKFKHLAGNYGGAWQDQAKEFDAFPGSILMTTNCIQKPRESYKSRIFTTGLVAWPEVRHIANRVQGGHKDFSAVIDAAVRAGGFSEDVADKTITIGFARNAVLSVADKVIDAVKGGQIRHFFLVGGCDGAKSGRNYYTDLAVKIPKDCVILTLACGKYRFNKLDFGDIGGIPRLLDIGQCNDAHSAIQIAVALAGAFNCDVNDLPLSMILSWYEQKAVVILLSLLSLGIKSIRLGPSLPAFVSPNVLNVLVENFNIMPVSDPDQDLKAILGTV
ncbi:MAG: hydroxylamine reductase [Candidatus Wallbacteria bacterium HGW-Wallbacteria-1]|uniref:Hydroxylamine reductase n=1 Tax=Candidatus Wallbacteria bacterium HGW-Wallbacteria-1 TaxID=2013854 RepID=A0A2N1PT83_9BACT|nr:MAG: hydroxylamine reductase [Candidatus Wallbacteria bacterium HGW-Wallbacteria-1]